MILFLEYIILLAALLYISSFTSPCVMLIDGLYKYWIQQLGHLFVLISVSYLNLG